MNKDLSVSIDNATIREVFLANGFTIKPGETDLKPYVYDAARELIAAVHRPAETLDPTYTSAIGEAGQAYMDRFKPYAHPLPATFRWEELWDVLFAAATRQSKASIGAGSEPDYKETPATQVPGLECLRQAVGYTKTGGGRHTIVLGFPDSNTMNKAFDELHDALEASAAPDRDTP